MTSDRGLCGGFNSSIVRAARRKVRELREQGKDVKIFCVGRKGRDMLKRDLGDIIIGHMEDVGQPRLAFANAAAGIGIKLPADMVRGRRVRRLPSRLQQVQIGDDPDRHVAAADPLRRCPPEATARAISFYEYEPDETEILEALLPRNLAVQVFRALLENKASEQGARMTAMDNATRNAGDMINRLTMNYNRSRQADITKELIEIISGAEAV